MTLGPRPSGLYSALDEKIGDDGVDPRGPGLWSALSELTDPTEFRPEVAADIEVKVFHLKSGNDYAMLANPRDLLHYQIQVGEAELLPLMDGTRTVKEIVVERFRDSGELELSGVADLVRLLHVGNFLTRRYLDVEGAVRHALNPVSSGRAKARKFAKTLSIEWEGANRLVEWFYRAGLKWLFEPIALVLSCFVAVAGFLAFLAVQRSGQFTLTGRSVAAESLALLGLSYVLTFIHELGHALVLVHYGRRVKSAGFMIYFGSPAFFVESADALMLDRGKRVLQAFGGPFSELIVAAFAAIYVWVFPHSAAANVLYKFTVLNYFVIFLNLIPLLELDGYFILADLIQVPDLRPRSLQFIRYDLWRKLRRRQHVTKQEVGLGLYGVLGILFTILSLYTAVFFWEEIFGGLVRQLWHGGLAGQLLLVGLALFLVGPALRGFVSLLRTMGRGMREVSRKIRFRFETGWRVEAAKLIDALPMFEDLPEEVLSDLAGRVHLRSVPPGKPIIRQGDRPDAFYVVRRGTFHVVEEDPETQKERVLRVVGSGEAFGELGLVDGRPRTATVRAVEDAQVYEIDKSTFDHLLADMIHVPEFGPTLQAAAELRALPPFAALEASQLAELLEHGEWFSAAPGHTIIEQGDVGDSFYVIGSGQVEVSTGEVLLATQGRGEYFGEIALLMDVPRTATVVAKTPARLFRLDREGFDNVVGAALRRGALDPTAAMGRSWQH